MRRSGSLAQAAKRRVVTFLLAHAVLVAAISCRSPERTSRSVEDAAVPASVEATTDSPAPVVTGDEPPQSREREQQAARARCEERIASALEEPTAPGTPELDRVRPELFAAVKAEPVLFTRRPKYLPTDKPALESYRRWLGRSKYPLSVLGQLMPYVLEHKEDGRLVLLRDGYLYAEEPVLAQTLVSVVKAEHLFSEPEIWIQRGERVLRARRAGKTYRYVGGPQDAETVALLLFDRVGVGSVPRAVHRDLRSLRYRLHFDHLSVVHLGERWVVADLFYGKHAVRTLLRAEGPRLEVECESTPPAEAQQVNDLRQASARRNRAFSAVQRAIAVQIDDQLPFDEPLTEVGQEDGELRPLWIWAYEAGKKVYEHRTDRYPIFDGKGRALVPEVCVDFLLDTLERASGTWWRPQGQPRERSVGKFDFDRFDRVALRRAPQFVAFARAHPEWFDVLEIPETEQHEMRRDAFIGYLVRHAADFIPGDMVLIAGRAPWDPSTTIHYHSFFIFESDPLTGMPLLVAGNPGRPRLVIWNWERQRTPRRSLRYRIRPNPHWLESIVDELPTGELEPPPLSDGPP